MDESLRNANIKMKNFEEDALKCKTLEEKLRFMEKKYSKDMSKLQNELTLFKKY